jgi:hypothetical protein
MNNKTLIRAYWIATIIFALFLVMDGVGGVMRADAGKESLAHLGYPMYLLTIAGAAKLLAAVAILQTKCYGALCSRIAVGDSVGETLLPLVFFAIMLVPYWLWKKTAASTPAN